MNALGTHRPKNARRTLRIALAFALMHVAPAWADDLSLTSAIEAAKVHDQAYLAADTLTQTAESLRAQASSLWRPQVMLSATAGKSSAETRMAGAQFSAPSVGMLHQSADFNTSINGGTLTQWSVSAKQPLYQPARRAQSEQLRLGADMAQLQRDAAEQALIVRTAERYYDAQLAQQKLQLLTAQLNAIARSATEAKYRFDIGDRPVTEVYEAQAQYSEIQAAHFAAQSDLQVKLQRLQDAIGHVPRTLPNAVKLRTPLPKLASLDTWLARAKTRNVNVQLHTLAVQNAQAKAKEYTLGASASIDVVGQIGRQKLSGDGDFGAAKNAQNTSMIGVQLNVPLYTGGYNSAKYQESQAALKKAQLELQATQEQTDQQVRANWLGVQTAQLQINALQNALKASNARLDATRTGQEVGHRTVQDVLNAQNQNTQVRLNLEAAKQQYVLSRLRLGELTQSLQTESVREWVIEP